MSEHGIRAARNTREMYKDIPDSFRFSRTNPALVGDIVDSGWGRVTERRWAELEVLRLTSKGVSARVHEESGYVAVM